MNEMHASGGVGRNGSFLRRLIGRMCTTTLLLGLATQAPAQLSTNHWLLTVGGNWSAASSWSNNAVANAAGALVYLNGNSSLGGGFSTTANIALDMDVTLGYLIWGDVDRGSSSPIYETTPTHTLTFDTGDSRMALLTHGSGDFSINRGQGNNYIDTRIYVADPQGLYIDNLYSMVLQGGATNARAFDGGGHDIIKGEDGNLVFRRIVTNVNNLIVRDGLARIDYSGEINVNMRPDITNVVLGVTGGAIDTGALHPLQTTVNNKEGEYSDRSQLPWFEVYGVNNTNSTLQMTNTFNLVMNRGVVRLYSRAIVTNATNPNFYATLQPGVMSGTVTLNGDADVNWFSIDAQDGGTLTSSVKRTIFSGPITGAGGFTKIGYGEMSLTGTNDFTGRVNINRGFYAGPGGLYGGVALREGGILTGVEGIVLNRNGDFYIDNSAVNIADRVNDNAWIVSRGYNSVKLGGNASAASSESFGRVTNLIGQLSFMLDRVNGSPQAITVNLAGLARSQGGIVTFNSRDTAQGIFGTNVNAMTVNVADGASLAKVGSGGAAGTTTRSVALGIFAGDAADKYNANANDVHPNRADEFMTLDGTRLRTLDYLTETVSLGGRTTNALTITQSSAPADANVNIDYMAMSNNVSSRNDILNKVVQGAVTFNSIRIGVVSNATGGATDAGRVLLLSEGGRLTSESGMLLAGRDVGSSDGDAWSGGNVTINRGILDLDGAAGNRQAIVMNESGQSLFIRSTIEAGNGLTKGGVDSLVLDGANLITGTVYVTRGNLVLYNDRALGAATQVVTSGRSALYVKAGTTIMGVDLLVHEPDSSQTVLASDSKNNTWGGDIIFRFVEPQGMVDVNMPSISPVDTSASLTLLGDIGMETNRLPTADLNLTDAPRWGTTVAGILNIYGNVGDYVINGQAVTYDASLHDGSRTRVDYGDITNRINDENYVLRYTVDGSGGIGNDGNVNVANPWRAVGRLTLAQGVIRYLGDPGLGTGDFYTDQVLTNSNPERSGQTGFALGSGGTLAGEHVLFLMTKDGQRFNAERWTVDSSVRNNTIQMGLEHFGPTNATVTIGNDYDDGSVSSADNRITMNRTFRLFSHNGWDSAAQTASVGRVNVQMSLYGDQNGTLMKLGSGVVYLQGPTNLSYDEANEIRTNLLMGGELVLDRKGVTGGFDAGLTRSRASGSTLILAGGDLTHQGSLSGHTSENFASNLLVRAGDSVIQSRTSGAAGTNTLFIATGTGATITRQAGGTVNFMKDLTAGGGAGFQVGLVSSARVGPWAVVSSNGMPGYAFAGTDAGRWITMANLDLDTYGAAFHTDVVSDGFGGTRVLLPAEIESETLRFNADSGIDLNGQAFRVNQGGILVTPNAMNTTSNGAATIFGGWLTSSNGEMIVHNYNTTYGFGIGAAITGVTAFTHSGTGNTTLSGANTFVGSVYLNGGTLSIDTAARLGDTNNTLEMRGGVLNMTASMDLGGRTNVLGGDGGIYRVASGMTVVMSGPILTETNFFGSSMVNSGHGDFIKEGAGTLAIDRPLTYVGTYEGLTDIREGTLEVRGRPFSTTTNSVFGSSKSFYDGTIVRSGATLFFAHTNNVGGTVNNTMPDFREWLILEQGSTIRWRDPDNGVTYQGIPFNSVIDIRGDASFVSVSDEVYFNQTAGTIMGSGALIWTGSTAHAYGNYPDFTGRLVIEQGNFQIDSPHSWAFPNASGIELGRNDNVNRGATLSFRPESDGVATRYDIPQDILVQGNSASTQLGYNYDSDHDGEMNLYGKLDLTNFDIYGANREFTLIHNEGNLRSRNDTNGDSLQDDAYLSVLGEILGGNKRIRLYMSGGGTLDNGTRPTNEIAHRFVVTFAGTNTGWTGALEVGNRQGTDGGSGPDFDKKHVMRFGLDEGLPTWAIGSNNIVVLRHDAVLQARGSQVTIGSLIPDGNSGGDGFWGNEPVTNTWLENGGFNPGTLTIVQVSNKVFSGGIRNGTVYNPFVTNSSAAALSIVKDGLASLTLMQSNSYSGTTRIMAGTLALTGTAAIAQSPSIQIDAGAFLNVTGLTAGAMTLEAGQTLKGSGTMVGGLIAASGSTVAPGTSPGVLTTQNDVTFQSGSTFEVELLGTLAGQADQLLMAGASDTLTLGGATLSVLAPNLLPYLSSFVIIDGFSSLDASRFAGLPNSGDTLTGGVNQFEIQYNANDVTLTVIPEPASLGLMGLVGIAGWLLRRRRR